MAGRRGGFKMKRSFRHIFFDLDHTLWDFDKNSAEVLAYLYEEFNLSLVFTFNQFIDKFREVNERLWNLYHEGRIAKEKIREDRFRLIFAELNVKSPPPEDIAGLYLQMCPLRANTMPHAVETLRYLKNKYMLHIITNGFEDVQRVKLQSAGILKFFDQIITSESCGYTKPHENIFRYALEVALAKPDESVMIGDNYEIDILGARGAGIKAIYYNPFKTNTADGTTDQITCLSELIKIL